MFADAGKLVCGAKARSTGRECQNTRLYANGRCKLHGGPSTGPKTGRGKAIAAKNGFRRRGGASK